MAINLNYRTYQPIDLPNIKALHRLALEASNAYNTGDIRKKLDKDFSNIEGYYLTYNGTFIVGYNQDQLISCGALAYVEEHVFEVCRMRTHPDCQGYGFGKIMYQKLEDHATSVGATKLILRTDQRLIAAQKFYERLGFVKCDLHDRAKGFEGVLAYEKILYSQLNN